MPPNGSILFSCQHSDIDWEQFPGNVIPGDRIESLIIDTDTLAELRTWLSIVKKISADPFLVLRPEFLTSSRAMDDLFSRTGRPRAHVSLCRYARPKLIRGLTNYISAKPCETEIELQEVVDLLVDCPMITKNISGVIGGLRIADIEANSPYGAPPRFLLPPVDEASGSRKLPRLGLMRRRLDVSVPLIIDLHNFHDSAETMFEHATDLLPSHSIEKPPNAATFLAMMNPEGDLPLALGAIIHELALMENAGAKFDLVIGLQGLTDISVIAIRNVVERLVRSIHASGLHPVSFSSNNIRLVSTRAAAFRSLLEKELTYFIVLNGAALEMNGGRCALMAGMIPIFLEAIITGNSEIDAMIEDSEHILPSREMLLFSDSRRPVWSLPRMRFPKPGSVRSLYDRINSGNLAAEPLFRKKYANQAKTLFGELEIDLRNTIDTRG